MKNECRVISITNQKGGVGKTVTTACLGAVLHESGKRVLLIDFDPQGHLTKGLGYRDNSEYKRSLKDLLMDESTGGGVIKVQDCILHTKEGLDLIPSNIELSGVDIFLSSAMSRESLLRNVISDLRDDYDYILIDNNPSLNLFTINALTASDSIIIPVQAEPYATDGLQDLLLTVGRVRYKLNPKLEIDGILITMTDDRTNLSRHVTNELRENYHGKIHVFKNRIPRCVSTAEAPLSGVSPIEYSSNANSSIAYKGLGKEVLRLHEKRITKDGHEHQHVR